MSIDAVSGIQATLARIREITGDAAMTPATGFASALADARASGAGASAAGPGDGTATATSSGPSASVASAIPASPASTVTGAQLDAWMAKRNPGSPLIGMGDVFVREGLANGIDPRALVAIANAESSLGSDPGAQARHNAFGWGPTQSFGSWAENIATVAKGLRTGYLNGGLTSLAQIQARYAPLGVANDPSNLNSNWLHNTTAVYAELGGDPSGSVALA